MSRARWLHPALSAGSGLAAAVLTACSSMTGPEGSAPDLRGSWSYQAQQTAPVLTFSGTLLISSESGRSINGQLQVLETNQAGVQRQLSGIVAGVVPNATTVDFDAFLEQIGRRHVGRLAGDSITGSWVDDTGEDVPLGGTFKLRRQGSP